MMVRRSDDRLAVSSVTRGRRVGFTDLDGALVQERSGEARSSHVPSKRTTGPLVEFDSKRGFRGEGHLCPEEGLSRTLA